MKKYLTLICILIFIVPLGGADVEFTASVDSELIGLEDYLIYTVTFKGIQNPVPPDVSGIGDFNVIQTSRSSEFKFINGISSSYVNFLYYLAPLKEGALVIPPLKYVHNNNVFKTQGFKIVAVKGSIKKVASKTKRRSLFDLDEDLSPFNSFRSAPQEIDVRLRARISKKRVLVGEQLIYRILLYSRNRIESVNLISGQSFPGFWQEWYPVRKSIDGVSEIIEGKSYQVYEIRKAALFPSKDGELLIPSVRFELSLSDNSFSFFSTPKRITRSTNTIRINAENLSDNSKDFPVGRLSITVKAEKDSIDINELLSIKIEVKGFGNIKTLKIPEFSNGEAFKKFPSKITRKIDYKDNGIFGNVIAEVPVSFKEPGVAMIPSLEFKYFDPLESKIKVSKSRELSINVTGKREEYSSNSNPVAGGIAKIGSDIDFIMKGSIYDQKRFIYRSVSFRVIVILIFIIILSFPIYEYIIKSYILGSKRYKNKKDVQSLLKKLDNLKEHGDVFQIIEGFLEVKTGIRRSEINKSRIENLFYSSGINKKDTEEFLRIRTETELSRFSPSTIKTFSQFRNEITELKNLIKRIDLKLK